MYRQDKFDREPVASRIAVFRDQIERRLAGEITEEQFRPMRRTNGVYLRDHAYMLRIPVPNGVLSSTQLRMLAHIARHYDRGYAHFTADQNVEFQWPALSDTPSALTDLAAVDLYPTGAGSSVGRTAEATHRPSDPMSVTIPLDGACDLSDCQMEILADLAETYGLGELHLVGGQDIVLPHVATADLAAFHAGLASSGFRNRRHSDPAPFTEEHHARETEAA